MPDADGFARCFADRFPEALEVHNFAFAQKLDDIAHIAVIRQAQDVVVGRACLLLRCEILGQVGDGVPGRLEGFRGKRCARRGDGIDPRGVIHEIGVKPRILDLLHGEVARQLVQDRGHDLDVRELLGAHRSIRNVPN